MGLGSRLATYKEVEDSYNDGGEWCNYGWSEDQMALFPTQQKTYDGLQKIKGHENDCGRPGINGGYMVNPQLRFGVNCYGIKPSPKGRERVKSTFINDADAELQTMIDRFKKDLDNELITLGPFNHDQWSGCKK